MVRNTSEDEPTSPENRATTRRARPTPHCRRELFLERHLLVGEAGYLATEGVDLQAEAYYLLLGERTRR